MIENLLKDSETSSSDKDANSDDFGEIDMPYAEDELRRPFSDDYDITTLDFVATIRIARGDYNNFQEGNFIGQLYEPYYDENDRVMELYRGIPEDIKELEISISRYDIPKEQKVGRRLKAIAEMFREAETKDTSEEETPADNVISADFRKKKHRRRHKKEGNLEHRLAA